MPFRVEINGYGDQKVIWKEFQVALAGLEKRLSLGGFTAVTFVYRKHGGRAEYCSVEVDSAIWFMVEEKKSFFIRDRKKIVEFGSFPEPDRGFPIYIRAAFTGHKPMNLVNIVFHLEMFENEVVDMFYCRPRDLDKHFEYLEKFRAMANRDRSNLNTLCAAGNPYAAAVLRAMRARKEWEDTAMLKLKDIPLVSGCSALEPLPKTSKCTKRKAIEAPIRTPPASPLSPTGPIPSPIVPGQSPQQKEVSDSPPFSLKTPLKIKIPASAPARKKSKTVHMFKKSHPFYGQQWAQHNMDTLPKVLKNVTTAITLRDVKRLKYESHVFKTIIYQMIKGLEHRGRDCSPSAAV